MLRSFILCLLMAAMQCHAAPVEGDAFEILNVSADRAGEDPDREVLRLAGNLRLETREWVLEADSALVYGPANRPERVVLTGAPVRLQTIGDSPAETDPLAASAPLMEYRRSEDNLVLSGGAELRQEGQVVRSEVIVYDIEPGRFHARGDGGVLIEVPPDG